jgi:predicted hotdog family 3-hydroxylacyl-ACP dehydratase
LIPEDVLPHRGSMLLLSRIVSHAPGELAAQVDISSSSTFAIPAMGVPRYVGIEYMAQAIAALEGVAGLGEGHPVTPGYLLGTRQLGGIDGYFSFGQVLDVRVREVMRGENGLGAFACELREEDRIMQCQLTVFSRATAERFARGE